MSAEAEYLVLESRLSKFLSKYDAPSDTNGVQFALASPDAFSYSLLLHKCKLKK